MGELHIISRSARPFPDRKEAGRLLGESLKNLAWSKENPVVLGILRGGIIVAREVARILESQLDIILSRKISAPLNPELALGAISENGDSFLNEEIVGRTDTPSSYIDEQKEGQLQIIKERIEYFRKGFPKIKLTGRQVIVVDDGVATGATMVATIWSVKRENPRKLVVALPVGPEDSLRQLSEEVDSVICLRVPELFSAVGQFYSKFEQTGDEEVLQIINEEKDRITNEAAKAERGR
jgi:predicted phosphoribosyltransferase